jgi:hypothetical protein
MSLYNKAQMVSEAAISITMYVIIDGRTDQHIVLLPINKFGFAYG